MERLTEKLENVEQAGKRVDLLYASLLAEAKTHRRRATKDLMLARVSTIICVAAFTAMMVFVWMDHFAGACH